MVKVPPSPSDSTTAAELPPRTETRSTRRSASQLSTRTNERSTSTHQDGPPPSSPTLPHPSPRSTPPPPRRSIELLPSLSSDILLPRLLRWPFTDTTRCDSRPSLDLSHLSNPLPSRIVLPPPPSLHLLLSLKISTLSIKASTSRTPKPESTRRGTLSNRSPPVDRVSTTRWSIVWLERERWIEG